MKIKFKRLYQAFIAYRHSENLGDFALLKADALGVKTEPAIAKKMEQIRGYSPQTFITLQIRTFKKSLCVFASLPLKGYRKHTRDNYLYLCSK